MLTMCIERANVATRLNLQERKSSLRSLALTSDDTGFPQFIDCLSIYVSQSKPKETDKQNPTELVELAFLLVLFSVIIIATFILLYYPGVC